MSFPEQSRTSAEIRSGYPAEFWVSISKDGDCTASPDNLSHLLKNLVKSFFLTSSGHFPSCNLGLLPLIFFLCISEKGPAPLFLHPLLGWCQLPPKTIYSRADHAKFPQPLLVHGVPQSPVIPVAPPACSTFSTILQPCCEQWPSHSQG